jgi:hypothetical protein
MPYLIKSKFSRFKQLKENLKLAWASAIGVNGHITGQPSKHRFTVNGVVTLNKNLDDSTNYVREISVEEYTELDRLKAKCTELNAELQAAYKAYADYSKLCFETGRPITVDELLKSLKESAIK